ncbi:MAG: hypothetical protein AAGH70_04035 [Pseudomonadota bacterium]
MDLIDPTEGRFLAFNMFDIASRTNGGLAILLGDMGADSTSVTVTFNMGSIWPYGHQHRTFPSANVEQSIAFIEELLNYSELAEDPDTLLRVWAERLTGPMPHAALAYLEVAVERDFGSTQPDMPFVMRTFAMYLLAGRSLDGPAQQQLALIAPTLPQTLSLPVMIDQSVTAGEVEARLLRNLVVSSLSARGADVSDTASQADLRAAFASLVPILRKPEATRLLAAFDLGIPLLDDGLADDLMRAVLQRDPLEPPVDGSPAARRAAWAEEIATFID